MVTNSRVLIACLLALTLNACDYANAEPVHAVQSRVFPASVSYKGHWQLVNRRRDGRYDGSSIRSYHAQDCLTIVFKGSRLRMYGIVGPGGGKGAVVIPGRALATVNFRAAQKKVHRLVYDSGALPRGIQSASVVVLGPSTARHGGYVNIDEIDVLGKE